MLAEFDWNALLKPEIVGTIMGCAIPIAGIIGGVWYASAKTRAENELKRTMVERGMSADEIERVLAAKSGRGRKQPR